jgi:hypothetical protein
MNEAAIQVGDAAVRVFEVSTTNGVVNQEDFGLHEPHPRGRNWIAVITPDRSKPGGLDRAFCDRVRKTFYRTADVRPGDFIEVGADYFTGAGRRYPKRAFFRLLIVRANTWVLRVSDPPDDTLTIPPYTPEAEAARAALATVVAPPEPQPQPMTP